MRPKPVVAICTGIGAILGLMLCTPGIDMKNDGTPVSVAGHIFGAIVVTGFGFFVGLTIEGLIASDPPSEPPGR